MTPLLIQRTFHEVRTAGCYDKKTRQSGTTHCRGNYKYWIPRNKGSRWCGSGCHCAATIHVWCAVGHKSLGQTYQNYKNGTICNISTYNSWTFNLSQWNRQFYLTHCDQVYRWNKKNYGHYKGCFTKGYRKLTHCNIYTTKRIFIQTVSFFFINQISFYSLSSKINNFQDKHFIWHHTYTLIHFQRRLKNSEVLCRVLLS